MEWLPRKLWRSDGPRTILLGAAVLLGAGALLRGLGYSPAPPHWLTVPAKVADIEETVLASGTIQPRRLVSVGAQASGRVIAVHAALGDRVTQGQLIAEIDPSTEKNALDTALATLEQGKAQRASRSAQLHQAELALKRARATSREEASSQADLETAEAAFQSARADIRALDAQIHASTIAVDTARVTLGYTKVNAPIDGTVVAIVNPEGQTVNAVQSAPTLVKLADLDVMTVKAQISEADVVRVHAGQAVYFTILGEPEHRYYATLRAVEPAPESIAAEQQGNASNSQNPSSAAIYYNGLFDIPNPDRTLRPSMTAQVNIILRRAKAAITIPSAAVGQPQADGLYVVRVVDKLGLEHERRVHIGINNSVNAQVLDGVTPGEQVIVEDTAPDTNRHRSG